MVDRNSNQRRGSANESVVEWLTRVFDSPPIDAVYFNFPWKAFTNITQRIHRRNWTAYLVGGAIRDLVISRGRRAPRDLDVVVSNVRKQDLLSEFRDFSFVRYTRFGGLRLKCFDTFLDIWPLNETHTMSEKRPVTVEDLTKSAFLDVEAIALELQPKRGRKRTIVESGFTNAVLSGTLEINCEPNPFPEVAVVKAVRTALSLNLLLGIRLVEFVQRFVSNSNKLFEAQKHHYEESIFTQHEIDRWLDAIRSWDARKGSLSLAGYLAQDYSLRKRFNEFDKLVRNDRQPKILSRR